MSSRRPSAFASKRCPPSGREGSWRTPPFLLVARYPRARFPVALHTILPFLALFAGSAHAQTGPYLTVTRADGIELASIALDDDATWHLAWNHSVTGILVRDFYEVRDGKMVLTHSHTPAFDAGLGHVPGRGRVESDGEGGYWIYDLDEPVPSGGYWLRVGSERVDHTLVHGERRVRLSALAANERVRIAVERP